MAPWLLFPMASHTCLLDTLFLYFGNTAIGLTLSPSRGMVWFSHWLLDIYFPLFRQYGGAHCGPMDVIPYSFSHIPFGLTLFHCVMDVIAYGIHIGLLDPSFPSNMELLIVWMLALMASHTNTLAH